MGVNEKKIRSDIREWKVLTAVQLGFGLVTMAAAFFCKLYPVNEKASEYAKMSWEATGAFAAAVCIGFLILTIACHALRRQAEF
jgi:hypothetical protein